MDKGSVKGRAAQAARAAQRHASADAAVEGEGQPSAGPADADSPAAGASWRSVPSLTSWWARVPAVVGVLALVAAVVVGTSGDGGSADASEDDDPLELFQQYVSHVDDEHLDVIRHPSLSQRQVQNWWDHWSDVYGYEYEDIEDVISAYFSDELFERTGAGEADPRSGVAPDVAFAHAISQSGWFQADVRTEDHNFAGVISRYDQDVYETYDSIEAGVRGHFMALYDYSEEGHETWPELISAWVGDDGAYWEEVVGAVYGSMLAGSPDTEVELDGYVAPWDTEGNDQGVMFSMYWPTSPVPGIWLATSLEAYEDTEAVVANAIVDGQVVEWDAPSGCDSGVALQSDSGTERFLYCSLDDVEVEPGDEVEAGDRIGARVRYDADGNEVYEPRDDDELFGFGFSMQAREDEDDSWAALCSENLLWELVEDEADRPATVSVASGVCAT